MDWNPTLLDNSDIIHSTNMTLSSSTGDSTMTPPATPTSPRLNTLPIRNPHTASHPRALPSHSINTALPERSNSPPYTITTKMDPTSAFVHTSPDGVWENSTPYTIMHEAPLGSGLWSSVYLASPIYPPISPSETPPATPVRRRGQSNSVSSTDSYTTQFSSSTASSTCITRGQETSGSAIWAIKAPADRAAFSVIRSEARMLTHIFSHTSPTTTHMVPYMVPFLGLDPRTGGVLMHALPLTLEDFIRGDLASLPEKQRTHTIASLFPQLAAKLLIGLEWLHEETGIVHADIKPSNILLRPTSPGMTKAMLQQRMRRASLTEDGPLERPSLLLGHNDTNDDDGILLAGFEPLYTDFSAAFPIHPFLPSFATSSPAATTPPPPPPNHLAGGTWDFLAPELCHRLHDGPSPASDVYALGVTLLCFVLGESPFEAVAGGNAFRKREMVKAGDAVGFAKGAGRGGRFARVGAEVETRVLEQGWSWEKWLRRGLTKDVAGRVGAGEWRRGLETGGLA